jgi:hypothetical protein
MESGCASPIAFSPVYTNNFDSWIIVKLRDCGEILKFKLFIIRW